MYPPTAFHFKIVFKGIDDPLRLDSGFQSISGLEAHTDKKLHETSEGSGSSQDEPGYSVLVLRRAARNYNESPLLRWIFSHFNKTNSDPLPEAQIELLDDNHNPFMVWTILRIIPKSWVLGELNAEKSEILIETIELYYEQLTPIYASPKKQVRKKKPKQ